MAEERKTEPGEPWELGGGQREGIEQLELSSKIHSGRSQSFQQHPGASAVGYQPVDIQHLHQALTPFRPPPGLKLSCRDDRLPYPSRGRKRPSPMALCLGQVFSKDKTFRPRKRFEPGTQRFELYKKAQASLKSGLDLRKVVQLPEGECLDDWIAVHVVDFFNRINLIYGTVSEYCTERTCPIMSGGLRYEYRWQDGDDYRKPTKLPALKYMNLLMDWIESLINNEDTFPTRVGVPFPKNFQQVCKKILSRLFRVFVHVYIHHFDSICSMGAEAHINTCYKHYYFFISEFNLIDHSELEPLKEMTEKICN
ncbi:MOB kinase activator 3C isoform X1 [Nerophis lumbriciformis]|uniref:MOB kinase activator 3C isoform X1 n=1 Tax=Nerophis lumbriciformis TaxID=546530 RepID=UPI002AE017AB|nr:MOB kinase activator 3C-like isoform X1 [Nerophis lumbriciformis]